jgi:hypothetical protein
MRRRVAASALVALVLVGVAGVSLTGVGPTPGVGSDVGRSPTETPAAGATPAPGESSGESSAGSESTATPTPPFGFSVDAIEACGWTCREVTSTLTNQQATAATDVTVSARIFAGRGTDGDVLWEGTEAVGTLDAGASYTATRRVELSYGAGFAVQRRGGWVTVQTTVRTADRTLTVTDERQVT